MQRLSCARVTEVTNRRSFLAWGVSAVAAPFLPAHTATVTDRPETGGQDAGTLPPRLVLVELAGGNDPWNTVIPYRNDDYYRGRPTSAVTPGSVLRLDDELGLHPAFRPLWPAWQEGRWWFRRDVVLPGADLTHFRSRRAWLKFWEQVGAGPVPGPVERFRAPRRPSGLPGQYPDTVFGRQVWEVAWRLLAAPGPCCHWVCREGFDLHGDVSGGGDRVARRHAELLAEVAAALRTLDDDLNQLGLAGDTAVVVWSELGRRCEENIWGGSEHSEGVLVLSTHSSVLQLFEFEPLGIQ